MKPTAPMGTNNLRLHDREYFYKYTKADAAMAIIKTRSLRWSSPLIFNDAFDVLREIAPNVPQGSIQEAFARSALQKLKKAGLINPDELQRQDLLNEFLQEAKSDATGNASAQQLTDSLREMWRQHVPRMRILCVTERLTNEALWALYADSHKGVVLKFENLDTNNSPLLLAKAVEYNDRMPMFADADGLVEGLFLGPKALFEQNCFLKKSSLRFEEEWRVVTAARESENGLYSNWPFAPLTLTEVIFGQEIEDRYRRDITSLLRGDLQHVKAYQASIYRGYEFKFEEFRR